MSVQSIFVTPVGVYDYPALLDSVRGWVTKEQPEVFLEKFTKTAAAAAKNFFGTLGYDEEAYDFAPTNLRLNEFIAGSAQKELAASEHPLSGCFYVDLPFNSNYVKFYTPFKGASRPNFKIKEFWPYTAEVWTVDVFPGNMVIWESYLQHSVPNNEFRGVRRSIGFDIALTQRN